MEVMSQLLPEMVTMNGLDEPASTTKLEPDLVTPKAASAELKSERKVRNKAKRAMVAVPSNEGWGLLRVRESREEQLERSRPSPCFCSCHYVERVWRLSREYREVQHIGPWDAVAHLGTEKKDGEVNL